MSNWGNIANGINKKSNKVQYRSHYTTSSTPQRLSTLKPIVAPYVKPTVTHTQYNRLNAIESKQVDTPAFKPTLRPQYNRFGVGAVTHSTVSTPVTHTKGIGYGENALNSLVKGAANSVNKPLLGLAKLYEKGVSKIPGFNKSATMALNTIDNLNKSQDKVLQEHKVQPKNTAEKVLDWGIEQAPMLMPASIIGKFSKASKAGSILEKGVSTLGKKASSKAVSKIAQVGGSALNGGVNLGAYGIVNSTLQGNSAKETLKQGAENFGTGLLFGAGAKVAGELGGKAISKLKELKTPIANYKPDTNRNLKMGTLKTAPIETPRTKLNLKMQPKIETPIDMSEETYLASNGVGRQTIGDAGLHKASKNVSIKGQNKLATNQFNKDSAIIEKRECFKTRI